MCAINVSVLCCRWCNEGESRTEQQWQIHRVALQIVWKPQGNPVCSDFNLNAANQRIGDKCETDGYLICRPQHDNSISNWFCNTHRINIFVLQWEPRYILCKLQCDLEDPLLIFYKNRKDRQKDKAKQSFLLQNYIGFEKSENRGQKRNSNGNTSPASRLFLFQVSLSRTKIKRWRLSRRIVTLFSLSTFLRLFSNGKRGSKMSVVRVSIEKAAFVNMTSW